MKFTRLTMLDGNYCLYVYIKSFLKKVNRQSTLPVSIFVCVYFSTGRCRQQRGSDGWHCKWIEKITDHTKPRFNNSINEWNTPNSLLTTWTHNCRLNGVFKYTWYFQKKTCIRFYWRTIVQMDVPWKIKTFSCG